MARGGPQGGRQRAGEGACEPRGGGGGMRGREVPGGGERSGVGEGASAPRCRGRAGGRLGDSGACTRAAKWWERGAPRRGGVGCGGGAERRLAGRGAEGAAGAERWAGARS